MQRQPRTPQEAAMLDPTGLLSFPAPNRPRGLFGFNRRPPFQVGTGDTMGGYAPGANNADDEAASPPPISMAPPPPADWRKTVGSDLMGQLPITPPSYSLSASPGQLANALDAIRDPNTLPPSPPVRGGFFGNAAALPQQPMPSTVGGSPAMSEKIGGRGLIAPDRQKARDKPKFFGHGGAGWDIIGSIGDALAQYGGGQATYWPTKIKERQAQADHQRALAEWAFRSQLERSKPDYATINNRRVRIDPTTGQADVLYTAPQDFEDYAATLGAEPGTEEYDRLVQDYVLRGGGPTATDNYNLREDWRQKNREELEGIRQSNRSALEGQRQAGRRALKAIPTYGQANPRPRSAGAGNSGGVREGQTATNPQTGAKVVYRGGKWVPAR